MLRWISIRCFELWIFIHHKMLIGFHKSVRIINRASAFLNITAARELLSPEIKKLPMLRRISIRCFELWIFIHHKMLIGFRKSVRIINGVIAVLNITAALELLSPYLKKLPMLRRIFIRCARITFTLP